MLQSSEFSSTWMVVLKVAVVMNFHSHFEAIHWSFWTVFLHTNFLGLVVKATTVVGSCVTRILHLIKSYDFHCDPFQAYFAVCPKTSVIRLHTFFFAKKLRDSFTRDAFVVWVHESVCRRKGCSYNEVFSAHRAEWTCLVHRFQRLNSCQSALIYLYPSQPQRSQTLSAILGVACFIGTLRCIRRNTFVYNKNNKTK